MSPPENKFWSVLAGDLCSKLFVDDKGCSRQDSAHGQPGPLSDWRVIHPERGPKLPTMGLNRPIVMPARP